MKRSLGWCVLVGFPVALAACGSDDTGPSAPRDPTAAQLTPELVVSDLMSGQQAGATAAETTFVYVSLHEGTVPRGTTADVSNRRSGFARSASLVAGALDPLPVPGEIGDTLDVVARDSAGAAHRFTNIAKRAVPPVVVRSSPSSGATDVPLLTVVRVVFSEPMDSTSLGSATVRVTSTGEPLPGAVLVDPEGLWVELHLDQPLARRTSYHLAVTTHVRDRGGQPMTADYVVSFTTGNPAPPDTTRFTAVSAGGRHTCAITTSAQLFCWGWNVAEQVTGGGAVVVPVPTRIQVSGGASAVRAGAEHTCLVTAAAGIRCWGDRRLESGRSLGSLAPYFPSPFGDARMVGVGAGMAHLCGILANEQAKCVGEYVTPDGGYLGFYGDSGLLPLYSDAPMQSISGGNRFDCGLSMAGQAYCFGKNQEGELGDGGTASDQHGVRIKDQPGDTLYLRFRTVAGNLVFNTLSVGWEHVCGVTAGRVYCWGSNSHGQLGTGGTEVLRSVPTPVAGSERYDSVAAGGRHTCALASGKALCWGDDSFGQLGDGRTGKPAPAAVAVAGDLRFLAVSAGTDHTCAITSGGALYCWGRNDTGQLGDGSLTDSSVPQLVTVGAVPELLRFPSR
jgi:hypothetical protein